MQFSPGARRLYWLGLVAVLTWFLILRVSEAVDGQATGADVFVFAVWFALLLAPLFGEVELLGIKLKQVVEEARKDVKGELAQLRQEVVSAVSVRTNVSSHFYLGAQGHVEPPKALAPGPRRPLEYQILNTLWTKQVNKWPDRSQLFTFRMSFADPQLNQAFREAASKLIGEGMVGETPDGQYFLTDDGFAYAWSYHDEFPPEQWWPEEPISRENLERVLEAAPPGATKARRELEAQEPRNKRILEAAEATDDPADRS